MDLNFIYQSGVPDLANPKLVSVVLGLSAAFSSSSEPKPPTLQVTPAETVELESEKATKKAPEEEPEYENKAKTASETEINAESDKKYFEVPEEHWTGEDLPGKQRDLEIWSLVRSSAMLCRSNSEKLELVREALQQCGFHENHEAYGNDFVHKRYNDRGNDKVCNRLYGGKPLQLIKFYTSSIYGHFPILLSISNIFRGEIFAYQMQARRMGRCSGGQKSLLRTSTICAARRKFSNSVWKKNFTSRITLKTVQLSLCLPC